MAKRKPSPSPSSDIIRIVGLGCIFLLSIAILVMGVRALLRSTPIFVVRDISLAESIRPLEISELLKLKGQNIFEVDLSKVESRIRAKYPQLTELRVMRRFPDQIFVTAMHRDAFAYALLDGKICVIDRNGYMMGSPLKDQPPLSLIKGLKVKRMIAGEMVGDDKVRLGIDVISLFHQDGRLPGLELGAVHVDDPSRVICDIKKDEAEFQVIIDQEHIAQRFKTFADVLSRGGLDFAQVKYIDLRFGEPVIGQKKVKK